VPYTLGLIRDRVVGVPRLEDVDWHIVSVSDLLPADKEIGEEGSRVDHMSALKGGESDERRVILDWQV
jgi:hypothetical protein